MYNNRKSKSLPEVLYVSYLFTIKNPHFPLKGKWGHGNNKGEPSVIFLLHILSV